MTRPLHAETKVQRGGRPTGEQRERGYEPSDASPGKVMLGVACFLGLLLAGLAFAAGTLGWLKGQSDLPREAGAAMAIVPPPPHLLADPGAARRRYDAAMDRHMDAAALARARQDLIRQGWGEAEPAPLPEAAARAHRDAAR
ncbi:hypothetical protein BV96_00553 [Sphingomonas paucimobilis]|nr:hypothetical protein BV96_00553 [Sphingomonas paucimobilis]